MSGNVDFMRIPPTLRLTTAAMEESLERRRQALLRDPWRPARGELVPWSNPCDELAHSILDAVFESKVVPFRR